MVILITRMFLEPVGASCLNVKGEGSIRPVLIDSKLFIKVFRWAGALHLLWDVPLRQQGFPFWLWWWRHLISLTQWFYLPPPEDIITRKVREEEKTKVMTIKYIIYWNICFGELTFNPSKAPASLGMVALLLLRVIRPIRWSPSLDGCHVTGCCMKRMKHKTMKYGSRDNFERV